MNHLLNQYSHSYVMEMQPFLSLRIPYPPEGRDVSGRLTVLFENKFLTFFIENFSTLYRFLLLDELLTKIFMFGW